jgi:hypothetical protein
VDSTQSPELDRSGEQWTGSFAGLGTVTVAADGQVTVTADPSDDEDLVLKEQALRWGWGEGLSFVQRGFQLAGGAAACPPGESTECLILPGDPHDVAMVLAALAQLGWSIMGDRYTPVRWEGSSLVAEPRQAPLIMAQRRLTKLGLEGLTVRADSDSRTVQLPRVSEARVVRGVALVSMRRPHEDALDLLAGQKLFESAAQLMLGGVLTPRVDRDDAEGEAEVGDPTPAAAEVVAERTAEVLAEHLRLAALPMCRLHLDKATLEDDIAALLRWWTRITVDGEPR